MAGGQEPREPWALLLCSQYRPDCYVYGRLDDWIRGGWMHPLRLSGQGEYIQRQKEARVITRIGRDTLAIGALVGDTDVSAGW